MQIKQLRDKLKSPKVMGFLETVPVDQSRDVIIQVFKGYKKIYEDTEVPVYEYYDVRAVGMLFHGGEFKAVIAVGEDDE